MSQFTYQNVVQYKRVEKEVARNKRAYNQSYEGFFVNDDGTINYLDMIQTIDSIIAIQADSFEKFSINKILDKDMNRHRNKNISHPESDTYKEIKDLINLPGADINEFEIDDEIDMFEQPILEVYNDEIDLGNIDF